MIRDFAMITSKASIARSSSFDVKSGNFIAKQTIVQNNELELEIRDLECNIGIPIRHSNTELTNISQLRVKMSWKQYNNKIQ